MPFFDLLQADSWRARALIFVVTCVALLAVYLPHLHTIPNGSSHAYMIDVGETQMVLNNWGTLHATGYPLYVMTGNILTDIMTAIGIDEVTAPALVSMLWGFAALALMFALAVHLTGRAWLAAAVMLLFGLTLSVWVHMVIAEVYTFGLMFIFAMLLLALYRQPVRGRVYWLALLGGIAVAHHRTIAMIIPALLYAAWPAFVAAYRAGWPRLARLLGVSLLLGAAGFLQYIYLYVRARAGADWVYGQPDSLAGLWDEIVGAEASHLIGPLTSLDALLENARAVTSVVIHDLTLPGALLGLAGLLLALKQRTRYGRAPVAMLLLLISAWGFHAAIFTDVPSALNLLIILPLVFGWLFLGDEALRRLPAPRVAAAGLAALTLILAAVLVVRDWDFIHDLTNDPTGVQTIDEVSQAPAGATVMLGWGPRYFAASVGQTLQGRLQHIALVDDRVDFPAIVESGSLLITPQYTFFNYPLAWWQDRLGQPVYLRAAGPYLVEIATEPVIADAPHDIDAPPGAVWPVDSVVNCTDNGFDLWVTWQALERPAEDFSVFVHALSEDGHLLATGDQFAPVYGWRPMTTWLPGEQVTDVYPVRVDGTVVTVRYGLYQALPDGGFDNVQEHELPVNCDD